MSNNDQKLIWEAYERSNDSHNKPPGLQRIESEWENDILPQLEVVRQDDIDYNINPDGNLVILFPALHLTYEQNIDLDMFSSNQVARLKQEFDATFGRYDFIKFEVGHHMDDAVENAHLTHEGQWVGVNVYIDEIEVAEDLVENYFKILLAVNKKAKELSMG